MAIDTQNNPQALTAGVLHYAQSFIKELGPLLMTVADFSRNFSADIRTPGIKVEVPYLFNGEVQTFNNVSMNFGTQTEDSFKTCTVELSEHPIIKHTITPEMRAKFIPRHWEEKSVMDAQKIAADIIGKIVALANGMKVQNPITVGTASAFTVQDVLSVAQHCLEHNLVPELSSLYLTPADYYALLKSMTWTQTGTLVMTNGTLGGVRVGFKNVHCLTPGATKSFVAQPDLIMLASKPYVGATIGARGDIFSETLVTEPNTGLTMVQTVVTNSATKDTVHNTDCWFGAEVGNKNAGVVITRGE